MKPMRVIVTGSRTWTDKETVYGALDLIADAARTEGRTLVVAHGTADGADTIADMWVRHRQRDGWPVQVERNPADWRTYGKRAGMVRNQRMVAKGADACLAFVLDSSAGATHCAETAEVAGIPTQWVTR